MSQVQVETTHRGQLTHINAESIRADNKRIHNAKAQQSTVHRTVDLHYLTSSKGIHVLHENNHKCLRVRRRQSLDRVRAPRETNCILHQPAIHNICVGRLLGSLTKRHLDPRTSRPEIIRGQDTRGRRGNDTFLGDPLYGFHDWACPNREGNARE